MEKWENYNLHIIRATMMIRLNHFYIIITVVPQIFTIEFLFKYIKSILIIIMYLELRF